MNAISGIGGGFTATIAPMNAAGPVSSGASSAGSVGSSDEKGADQSAPGVTLNISADALALLAMMLNQQQQTQQQDPLLTAIAIGGGAPGTASAGVSSSPIGGGGMFGNVGY